MSQFDPENNLSETENLHIHLTLSQDTKKASMPLPPETTPVPQPVFMPGMSRRSEEPTPTPTSSALPGRTKDEPTSDQAKEREKDQDSTVNLPRLRLHIQDVGHEGSYIFLSSVNASTVLPSSIRSIHQHLYSSPSSSSSSSTTTSSSPFHPPPTRSVTLILRDMDGVAYTTGTELDPDHKEIHFSLRYISNIATPRHTAEITGIIVHELVHCYQWNGLGSAPGGLIEGVADWVRLQCDLAPPHWKRDEAPAKWDVGYQGTAYFLQYLETRFGAGTVRRLNEKLRREKYEEKAFWTELVGRPVEQLFEDYKKTLLKKEDEK
ncbi:BSP-domain-containing protein [Hypoxylon sp. NC0597]|nr:BSP-domain-containing protein [Hypoxylon sp. NC0597]